MAYQKIKGMMSDGKTSRYVQVDGRGRLVLAPRGVGKLKLVSLTKQLAAASAYDANDVISENASTGTSWRFEIVARENGGSGYIVKAQAISESESVTPRLTLYLFNVAPTAALNDHAANTNPDLADIPNYVGRIDFPAMEALGTTDSNTIATPSTSGNLPLAFECAYNSDDLYGVLVTRDAYTQTATDDMVIKLTIEQF